MQHIESFGSLDNKLNRIDTEDLLLRWIPEKDDNLESPIKQIKKKREETENTPLSKEWMEDTVIFSEQMGDLFIPFAFYRDASNLFHSGRYQSAFCTYYMMLEYFFNESSWGIKNDAHKRNPCLYSSLKKTLELLPKFRNHHSWLTVELKGRNKSYNEEGLLFIVNRFRDELSHAIDPARNRNIFNDSAFFPLAFIVMNVCLYVSIKKRLLPFVKKEKIEQFLKN